MTFNDLVILALVLFPTELPSHPPTQWKESLDRVNTWLEIKEMDEGDPLSYEYTMEDFEQEISSSRQRLANVLDVPLLSFVQAMPSREDCAVMQLHLDREIRNTEALMHTYLHREAELAKYKEYIANAHEMWTMAYDARDENWTPYVRRIALKQLKEMMSDQDFYAGKLPYRYGILPNIMGK